MRVWMFFILSLLFFHFDLTSQTREVSRSQIIKYLKSGNLDSAHFFARKALIQSQSVAGKADVGIFLGRIKSRRLPFTETIAFYDSLNLASRTRGFKTLLATGLFDQGVVFRKSGYYDRAIELFKEAYTIWKNEGHPAQAQIVTNSIANIYKSTGDSKSAKEYFKELLASKVSGNDSESLGLILNNLGSVFLRDHQLDSALCFFKESLRLRPITGKAKGRSSTLLNIGETYRLLNIEDSAEWYFRASLKLKKEINHKSGLAILGNNLASLFLSLAQYDSAKVYLVMATQKASELDLKEELSKNLQLWSSFYHQTGEDSKALEALSQSVLIQENLDQNSEFITQMLIQFAKDKKDEELKLQNIQLRNTRYANTILIVSTSSFFLITVLLFTLFRLKQKQKKATEWRMREQHHRVGNNIAVLSTLLNQAGNKANSEEAKELALEGKSRLEAMNLLHSKLYWKDETATIALKPFITELTQNVLSLYIPYQPNAVSLDMEELDLPVTQAIPFSLILNEVLTNACKYGLRNTKTPELEIRLLSANGRMEIVITNNGLTNELVDKERKSPSFGVTLIQTLARQLHGTFSIDLQKTHAIGRFEMPINS